MNMTPCQLELPGENNSRSTVSAAGDHDGPVPSAAPSPSPAEGSGTARCISPAGASPGRRPRPRAPRRAPQSAPPRPVPGRPATSRPAPRGGDGPPTARAGGTRGRNRRWRRGHGWHYAPARPRRARPRCTAERPPQTPRRARARRRVSPPRPRRQTASGGGGRNGGPAGSVRVEQGLVEVEPLPGKKRRRIAPLSGTSDRPWSRPGPWRPRRGSPCVTESAIVRLAADRLESAPEKPSVGLGRSGRARHRPGASRPEWILECVTGRRVRERDLDHPGQPARPEEGRVEHVHAVRRGHDPDVAAGVEPVHLGQGAA